MPAVENDQIEALDRKIAALRASVAKLEALREVLADGTIGVEISEVFAGMQSSTKTIEVPGRKRKARKNTSFQKICRYFLARENDWATTFEISEATGVNRELVRSQIYKEHRDDFEDQDHPNPPKGQHMLRQYRIRPLVLKTFTAKIKT